MSSLPQIVLIAGPTATGKTALSVQLARALDGEIFNIDSVQVYRGFDIGSAKAGATERGDIPHHLIDIRDPGETFNVADYIAAAMPQALDVISRGKCPIFVGGTTLYISALLHGLVAAPPASEDLRASFASQSSQELHDRLREIDSDSASRLHPNDRTRVTRALEVALSEGESLQELQSRHAYAAEHFRALIIVLCLDRAELHRRIDERVEAMLTQGLIEETKQLMGKYGATLQGLRAVGYAQARDFLEGELEAKDVCPQIQAATRQFAKRQMTFWKNEPLKRGWQVRIGGEKQRTPQGKKTSQIDLIGEQMPVEDLAPAVQNRLREGLATSEIWYIDAAALCASGRGDK